MYTTRASAHNALSGLSNECTFVLHTHRVHFFLLHCMCVCVYRHAEIIYVRNNKIRIRLMKGIIYINRASGVQRVVLDYGSACYGNCRIFNRRSASLSPALIFFSLSLSFHPNSFSCAPFCIDQSALSNVNGWLEAESAAQALLYSRYCCCCCCCCV